MLKLKVENGDSTVEFQGSTVDIISEACRSIVDFCSCLTENSDHRLRYLRTIADSLAEAAEKIFLRKGGI